MNQYFTKFFQEKNLPYVQFEIEHNGQLHIIDNETIVEIIKNTAGQEAKTIKNTLVVLDFRNANINDYLRHLAQGYIKTNYAN